MILEIIVFIAILLIILIFIFLFFGLNVKIKLNKNSSDFKGTIEVKWFFIKLFSKNFLNSENNKDNNKDNNKNNNSNEEGSNDKKNKNKKFEWNEFKSLFSLFKRNLDDISEFFIVCIQAVKLKKFNTDLKIGFSSYVDTANIVGRIWAFSAIPNLSENFNLYAEPTFNEQTIDFQSEILFHIKLLKPAGKLLKLLINKDMIRLILKSWRLFNNV